MNNLRPIEVEMIRLIAQGLRTHEIAQRTRYTKQTVSTMRVDLLRKTGAINVAHLINMCWQEGILTANAN